MKVNSRTWEEMGMKIKTHLFLMIILHGVEGYLLFVLIMRTGGFGFQ